MEEKENVSQLSPAPDFEPGIDYPDRVRGLRSRANTGADGCASNRCACGDNGTHDGAHDGSDHRRDDGGYYRAHKGCRDHGANHGRDHSGDDGGDHRRDDRGH